MEELNYEYSQDAKQDAATGAVYGGGRVTTNQIIGVVELLIGGALLGAYHIFKDKDWSVGFLTAGIGFIAYGANIFLS